MEKEPRWVVTAVDEGQVFAEGVEIRVSGEPSADASEKKLTVERLYLGDKTYELYPERD